MDAVYLVICFVAVSVHTCAHNEAKRTQASVSRSVTRERQVCSWMTVSFSHLQLVIHHCCECEEVQMHECNCEVAAVHAYRAHCQARRGQTFCEESHTRFLNSVCFMGQTSSFCDFSL